MYRSMLLIDTAVTQYSIILNTIAQWLPFIRYSVGQRSALIRLEINESVGNICIVIIHFKSNKIKINTTVYTNNIKNTIIVAIYKVCRQALI